MSISPSSPLASQPPLGVFPSQNLSMTQADSQATEVVVPPEMTDDIEVLRQTIQELRLLTGQLRIENAQLVVRNLHLENLLNAHLQSQSQVPTQTTLVQQTLPSDSGLGDPSQLSSQSI